MCGNPIKDKTTWGPWSVSLLVQMKIPFYTTVSLELPVQFSVTLCLLSHWVCDCESVMTLYPLTFSSPMAHKQSNWIWTGLSQSVHASVLCPLKHREMWNVVSHSEALRIMEESGLCWLVWLDWQNEPYVSFTILGLRLMQCSLLQKVQWTWHTLNSL